MKEQDWIPNGSFTASPKWIVQVAMWAAKLMNFDFFWIYILYFPEAKLND